MTSTLKAFALAAAIALVAAACADRTEQLVNAPAGTITELEDPCAEVTASGVECEFLSFEPMVFEAGPLYADMGSDSSQDADPCAASRANGTQCEFIELEPTVFQVPAVRAASLQPLSKLDG